MFGFLIGLVGDAVAPLIDAVADFSARLLRKLALFLVAALCLVVVLIALTIAFDLWIATLAGPIVAALAVAGLYLFVAVAAVLLAVRDPAAKTSAAVAPPPTAPNPDLGAQIDQFTKPILDILQRFGLKREQLAVFAGATMAKRLGPVPLVGCAIVVGFLVGRLWKSWRHLLEGGLALSPFFAEMFGGRGEPVGSEPPVT